LLIENNAKNHVTFQAGSEMIFVFLENEKTIGCDRNLSFGGPEVAGQAVIQQ